MRIQRRVQNAKRGSIVAGEKQGLERRDLDFMAMAMAMAPGTVVRKCRVNTDAEDRRLKRLLFKESPSGSRRMMKVPIAG